MLEDIIANLILNRKRYLYAFLAFILSLLIVTVGVLETLFIAVATIIGYYLGSPNLNKKFIKIKNILSEDLDIKKDKWGNEWVEE